MRSSPTGALANCTALDAGALANHADMDSGALADQPPLDARADIHTSPRMAGHVHAHAGNGVSDSPAGADLGTATHCCASTNLGAATNLRTAAHTTNGAGNSTAIDAYTGILAARRKQKHNR